MLITMNRNMLEAIRILDNECFNRGDNYRSIDNLEELLSNNHSGCFVMSYDNEIVGYIFSRVLGNVGYIGPLGIKPSLRGKDLGKDIIRASCDALIKAGCVSVGLEVLPELGNNIGLYLRSGFAPTFSTITYRKKLHDTLDESNNVLNGKDIPAHIITSFDTAFRKEHNGYSLRSDIESAISHNNSSIYFYKEEDIVTGFLCYSPLINPYVWGAFLRDYSRQSIFESLFSEIEKANQGKELRIRINSRYKNAINMMRNSFEVERCILRMMLNDYEGEFMSLNEQSFIARSWVG